MHNFLSFFLVFSQLFFFIIMEVITLVFFFFCCPLFLNVPIFHHQDYHTYFFPSFLYFLNCSFSLSPRLSCLSFCFCFPCFSFVLFYYHLGYQAFLFFFCCPLFLNVPFFIIKIIMHNFLSFFLLFS